MNRAARRERKLLLKQQEEIERIQHTTLKLREKLRNAEDTNQVSHFTTHLTHTHSKGWCYFILIYLSEVYYEPVECGIR